jgi:hypothetical protein
MPEYAKNRPPKFCKFFVNPLDLVRQITYYVLA